MESDNELARLYEARAGLLKRISDIRRSKARANRSFHDALRRDRLLSQVYLRASSHMSLRAPDTSSGMNAAMNSMACFDDEARRLERELRETEENIRRLEKTSSETKELPERLLSALRTVSETAPPRPRQAALEVLALYGSAVSGSRSAQATLARILQRGGLGLPRDPRRAKLWAAEARRN